MTLLLTVLTILSITNTGMLFLLLRVMDKHILGRAAKLPKPEKALLDLPTVRSYSEPRKTPLSTGLTLVRDQ